MKKDITVKVLYKVFEKDNVYPHYIGICDKVFSRKTIKKIIRKHKNIGVGIAFRDNKITGFYIN